MEEKKQHRIVDENENLMVVLPFNSEKFHFKSELEPNLTGQILHKKLVIEKKQKISSDEHKQFMDTCSAMEEMIKQLNLKKALLRKKLCVLQEKENEDGNYSKIGKTSRKIYAINEKQHRLERRQSV